MTQVIEIVVIGATGSGKSHVLEVIDRALHSEYGQHVQVASHELSCERFMGSPGTKPSVSNTIFNLREQVPVSSSKAFDMKVSIDASELTAAVEKIEAVHGESVSFALDPLEQAIELTTRVLRDEREHLAHISMTLSGDVPPSPVYKRMSGHLEALLDAQLKRVSD